MTQFFLKDFRGFHDLTSVELRPITLLIGENSAGKSSFLAGLKFVLDFIRGGTSSFNQDPFQLGTFQQIAHYRGGKAGRARQFQLGISGFASPRGRQGSSANPAPISLNLSFTDIESQAAVSCIEFGSSDGAIRIRIDADALRVEYIPREGETVRVDDREMQPRYSGLDLKGYWNFVLRDIQYFYSTDTGIQRRPIHPEISDRVTQIASLGQSFIRQLSSSIEATSAIRTKPLRTYTPGLDLRDGEGSHVPFELAKLFRDKNKDAWKQLKADLEKFGHSSEMFREVGIKSFGTTVSDPFQILFSSEGPKTNMVDLGYGTSQVLPILYSVAIEPQRTRFLIQQPEVHLHPKAQAALGSYFIDAFVKGRKRFVIETHSDFIIDRIRQAVALGIVKRSDISVLFFERRRLENQITQIELDEAGSPVAPPESYRSFFMDEQLRTLGVR